MDEQNLFQNAMNPEETGRFTAPAPEAAIPPAPEKAVADTPDAPPEEMIPAEVEAALPSEPKPASAAAQPPAAGERSEAPELFSQTAAQIAAQPAPPRPVEPPRPTAMPAGTYMPGSAYRGAAAPGGSTPGTAPVTFGSSMNRQGAPCVQYARPVAVPAARAPEAGKKKKRGVGPLGTILLCLVSALLGGLLGGLLMRGSAKPQQQAEAQPDPALESRIAALEEAAQKAPAQQAYDAQTPVTTTQVYQDNVASVVGIMNDMTTTNVFGQTTSIASSGSGFVIREDGYVVTNFHVIQNAESLRVSLYNGQEYQATVVGYDADYDVAVLKIEAEELDAVTVGDSDLLRVGDQVAAIGNPLGELTLSMTVGYISARDREINTDGRPINMLQTDVAINSGNSGGPLFDMKGNVIGITTAKYSGSTSSGASIEGIGFALPINDVMGIVNDLLELGYVSGRAYLGVTTMEMDTQTAQMYSLPIGVYISSVNKGSCAERAGMQKGDIVLKLGDQETTSYSSLKRALRSFSPGDTTTITVYRAGAELELEITLDERPSEEEIANAEEAEQPEQPAPDDRDQSAPEQPQTPDGGTDEPSGQSPYGGFQFPNGDFDDWFRYFFGG